MAGRDIIVMGASSGGVEALRAVAAALPADLAAAVLVVVHVDAAGPQLLAGILDRAGPLPAVAASDGEPVRPGRIYVAPPDFHLVVDTNAMRLSHAPRENRLRPAADPLFRSAARVYGPRVVGVVLTGTLDDGTSGLLAIKARGGLAVVQEPADALFPGMPQSALRHVAVDHCVPLHGIAALLVRLASTPPEPVVRVAPHWRAPEPTSLSCPICHGVLLEQQESELVRFVCRTGHAFTAASLLAAQSDELETALWGAVRALQESASMERRIAGKQAGDMALRHDESAAAKEAQVRLLREMILGAGADAALLAEADGEAGCSERRS